MLDLELNGLLTRYCQQKSLKKVTISFGTLSSILLYFSDAKLGLQKLFLISLISVLSFAIYLMDAESFFGRVGIFLKAKNLFKTLLVLVPYQFF